VRGRLARVLAATLPALALALALAAQPAVAEVDLTYACSPPLPPAAANCSGWHTGATTLAWDWNQTLADPVPADSCDKQTIAADTTGTQVTCEVAGNGESTKRTITIKVDMTPPTITGAAPSRLPDYASWWNHPVDFTFTGTDATSGIASCDVVNYSAPDGAAAQVTGGCRDVAGNSVTAAYPLKYDGTSPAVTDAAVAAGDASATVSWRPSSDVVRTEVTRTGGPNPAPVTMVFDATTSSFRDAGLVNGTLYSYAIRVFDEAGNSSSATAAGVPSPPPVAVESTSKPVVTPLLRWRRVRGARYYNVQLFRNGRKILSVWPAKPRFQLARTWTFHGRHYRLASGRYRWYVWPGYGRRAAKRYGKLIRTASFKYTP
jgi:hypothetical protein